MNEFDDRFLATIGLDALAPKSAAHVLCIVQCTLELRVGQIIASSLSGSQLAEFESLVEAGDCVAAEACLRRHCPKYQRIADEQFDALVEALRRDAFWILAVEEAIAAERDTYEDMFSRLDALRASGFSWTYNP